jgi:RNA polymerase sigma factor (sigma-70 family)
MSSDPCSFATFGCGMPPDQFQALLEAARRGNETAWAEIYRDLSPAVLGYLRGSGAPEPEDTLGEVFLEVARDVAKFEGDQRQFKAWIFTIAHHRMIDARRHAGRRPVQLVAEPPEPVTEPLSDAADEALARIGAEEVQRVLGVLSPDQRAVLLLRILGDLSIEDTAAAVGKRPGAVKQLQRRGLATLKRELERKGVTL